MRNQPHGIILEEADRVLRHNAITDMFVNVKKAHIAST